MKIQAYIMVNTKFGKAAECIEQLEGMSCADYTLKTHEVYGVHSVMVELYTESTESLEDIITDMERLNTIRSMTTAPVVR